MINVIVPMAERLPIVVRVDFPGPVGPPGPAGPVTGATAYVHTQTIASATWTINHNLGRKVVLQVFSSGWSEVDAEWVNVNTNQVVVVFAGPMSGSALLF